MPNQSVAEELAAVRRRLAGRRRPDILAAERGRGRPDTGVLGAAGNEPAVGGRSTQSVVKRISGIFCEKGSVAWFWDKIADSFIQNLAFFSASLPTFCSNLGYLGCSRRLYLASKVKISLHK